MAALRLPVVLVVLAFTLGTPPLRADDIDDFVRTQMTRFHVPGLSLAIIRDGQVVKAQGYGFANVATRTPVRPETRFKIGSVSKQFIAAGIMLLVQDGRLTVDDPIGRFLDDAPPSWTRITLRHLLTHTSGLVREAPAFDPFTMQTDADLIRSAHGVPLRFEPGTRWEYCNTGYFVLADVIRRVSGRPWSEFIEARIFEPLGMADTHVTRPDSRPTRSLGYTGDDNTRVADDWPAVRPSGAFVSTVLDLARWDQALDDRSVLTESSVRQTWTPVQLADGTTHPYGFGWELAPFRGLRRAQHGGAMPGFRSNYFKLPDERLTLSLLTNAEDVDRDGILVRLADRFLPVVRLP